MTMEELKKRAEEKGSNCETLVFLPEKYRPLSRGKCVYVRKRAFGSLFLPKIKAVPLMVDRKICGFINS